MHAQPHELERYLDGTLPSIDADRLHEHFAVCEHCSQTLCGLQPGADTVVEKLKQVAGIGPMAQESECRTMVERIILLGNEPALGGRSRDPVEPLSQLRDYQIGDRLGVGGMGAVYRALHTKLGKPVALKLLPRERLHSIEAVARFEREMQIVGRLEHPNIVRATDAGVVDGIPFLVMELVDGIDLECLLRERGPLSISAACAVIRQAALGLQHAFQQGVIHRDLKPSNLMLGRAPEGGWQVKVLDMGLAVLTQPLVNENGLTSEGQLMGTIDYMAPEQGENTHTVDIRADIYSLGATLFKLLTGVPPLEVGSHKTTMQKLVALATMDPPDVRTLRPDVPEKLAQLIQRLLSKSPELRPARPVELAELLAPHADETDLRTVLVDASGMPELGFIRLETRYFSQSRPAAGKTSRAGLWAAAAGCLCLGVLLTVLGMLWTTAEGIVEIHLEMPTSIEQIRVDDQQVAWTLSEDQQAYRLKVKPGAISSIVLITRDGTELHGAIPTEGLVVDAGKSYRLSAKPSSLVASFESGTTTATPDTPENRERSAVEWGHALGGKLEGGNPKAGYFSIAPDGVLPHGPFEIVVLDLSRLHVRNADLARLDGLSQLTTLVLDDTELGDDGITRLSTLPRLTNLYLSQTQLTDAGLRHLERFGGLQDLHLTETLITDAGLASLAAWSTLKTLFLGRCAITDHSIDRLAACGSLRHLHLNGSQITQSGVERLRAALPRCRIESDYGDFQPTDP